MNGSEKTISEVARMGGHARAAALSPEELSEQGRKAVNARWARARATKKASTGKPAKKEK